MRRKNKAAGIEAAVKKPICGCGHHWSFHDKTGRCMHTEVKTANQDVVQFTGDGKPVEDSNGDPVIITERIITHEAKCTCQRYYGPIPHPEFVVPPLAEIEGD